MAKLKIGDATWRRFMAVGLLMCPRASSIVNSTLDSISDNNLDGLKILGVSDALMASGLGSEVGDSWEVWPSCGGKRVQNEFDAVFFAFLCPRRPRPDTGVER
uniref:Uncharacterized protein n=1 Tax=Panagrolaimus sp. JU765 TaxID=591449 RepID=A0AC34QN88_9BILA